MKTLIELMPPPASPGVELDLRSSPIPGVERLPSDYLEFVSRYGLGVVDGFLYIFVPGSKNPDLDLLAQFERQSKALTDLREQFGMDVSFRPYPEPGGIIPWGITDNGDVCFWRTSAPTPDDWSIVIADGRMSDWFEYAGSMSDFLEAVLSGDLACEIFPDDWPSDSPEFKTL